MSSRCRSCSGRTATSPPVSGRFFITAFRGRLAPAGSTIRNRGTRWPTRAAAIGMRKTKSPTSIRNSAALARRWLGMNHPAAMTSLPTPRWRRRQSVCWKSTRTSRSSSAAAFIARTCRGLCQKSILTCTLSKKFRCRKARQTIATTSRRPRSGSNRRTTG